MSARARRCGPDVSLRQTLAACAGWACIARPPHAQLLDLQTGVATALASCASCACFDASGARLLAAEDKTIVLYDSLPPGAPSRRWTHGKKVGCVAFSPDGCFALWSDFFGEVYSVALDSEATPSLVLGHLSPVSHMTYASSGGALLTADREGHVRSSQWPHAFVIECYYLWHTSPLLVVLPLASSPLMISAACDGHELCVWRAHSGVLLNRTPAQELLSDDGCGAAHAGRSCASGGGGESGGGDDGDGGDGGGDGQGSSGKQVAVGGDPPNADSEADAVSSVALACACEITTQSLIALGFVRRSTISFCGAQSEWDASAAKLRLRTDLTCTLPGGGEPAALAHSASTALLCVLFKSGEAVALLPAAAGGGFSGTAARLVRLDAVPSAEPADLAFGADEVVAASGEAAANKKEKLN